MNILQKIGGLISIFNRYTQKIVVYPNEDMINSYLKEKFKEIEMLIFDEEFEKAEFIIDDLLIKQENLNERFNLEGYKIEIMLSDGKYRNVVPYIEKFNKDSQDKYKLSEWLYKFSVVSQDVSYYNKAKKSWKEPMKDEKFLFSKEVEISLVTSNYENMMNLEDNLKELGSDKELYYFSIMYLNTNNLEKANKYITKALALNKTDYAIYIQALISLSKIFSKRRYKAQIDKDEKIILEHSLTSISEIDCSKVNLAFKRELSKTILAIKILLDKTEAILYFNTLDDKLKLFMSIQVLRAMIYELENKFEKANEIYNMLLHDNKPEQFIERIITNLFQLKKYEKVILYYNEYTEITHNKEEMSLFYLLSMTKLYKEDDVHKKLELQKDTITNFVYWYILAVINENNKEKCIKYLENSTLALEENSYLRLSVSQLYRKFNEYDKALAIIEDMATCETEAYKQFIRISLESKKKKWLDKCGELWSSHCNGIEDFEMMGLVYYVLCELKQDRRAFILSELLYNKYKTIGWLFEFVSMKVLNNKLNNIEPLLSNLSLANDDKSLILCAYTYMKLGEKDKSWKIAYKVMIKLKDFDYELYKNIVAIYFNYIALESYNLEIEENSMKYPVKINDVVTLKNEEENIIKICLNDELVFRDKTIRFDFLNIGVDNELWYTLLGSKRNDKVTYIKSVYQIVDIKSKYIEMASFCFGTILKEQTENKKIKKEDYIRQISIQGNDLSGIIEFMKKDRERQRYIFDIYNHKNKEISSGIPIYLLLRDKVMLPGLFDSFKHNKEIVYFSGTPNISNIKKYVLTYTSVVLLQKLDILKYINDTTRIQVTSGLVDEVKEIISKMESNFNKKDCSLFITNEDSLFPYEKSKEEKVSELKYWNDILKFVIKCNIANDISILENKLLFIPSQWVLYSDLEAISLAVRDNSVLIVEDMFVRSLVQCIYPSLIVSNSYPIIEMVKKVHFQKFYKTLLQLIELKYYIAIGEAECYDLFINYGRLNGSLSGFDKLIKSMIKNDIGDIYKNMINKVSMLILYK